MSFRVELTKKELREIEEIKQQKIPVRMQGECAQCHRGIPHGYLALVTKWATKDWSGMRVAVPRVMYCKECVPPSGSGAKRSKVSDENSNGTKLRSDRVLVSKLIRALSRIHPRSSRELIERAKIDADKKQVVAALHELYAQEIVDFAEGRWILK